MKSFLFSALIALSTLNGVSQTNHRKALFIGNSYTYYNDLPALIANVALSVGDTLDVDSSTPGGTTFAYHTGYAITQEKIHQGDWDYVVLQEQSQAPAFPIAQVEADVFPYAQQLCDTIRAYNDCAIPMFYMTWGRQNGDASNCAFWPPICTYEGMDSLLHERYMMMGQMNQAEVSPVGAVWYALRQDFPDINLYFTDGSHPSEAGSYAAAVCFYTCMFRKDPTLTSFNFVLDEATANIIRNTAKDVVYDHLSDWYVGNYDPTANFSFTGSNTFIDYHFINESPQSESWSWDFGDGSTSSEENPFHEYSTPGEYSVQLIISHCGRSASTTQVINVSTQIQEQHFREVAMLVADGRLLINTSAGVSISEIKCFDQMGKQVVLKANDDKACQYPIDHLTLGVYSIVVTVADGGQFVKTLFFP